MAGSRASWGHLGPSRGKSEVPRRAILAHRGIPCLFRPPSPGLRLAPVVTMDGATCAALLLREIELESVI
jgi:hypothetical protein